MTKATLQKAAELSDKAAELLTLDAKRDINTAIPLVYVDAAYRLLLQAGEILELLADGSARAVAKLEKEYPPKVVAGYLRSR